MKRVSTAIAAGLLTAGLAGAASLLGTTGAGASVRPHTFSGTITVKATMLSLQKGLSFKISGTGFANGDTVVFSICNTDTNLANPETTLLYDYGHAVTPPWTSAACEELANGIAPPNAVTAGTKGTFSTTLTTDAGEQGTDATSECPPSAAQVTEGVVCVIGGDVLLGPDAGSEVDAPMWFTPPPITASDAYQTEGTADTPSTAEYDVTLTDIGGGTNSGLPPVTTAYGVPNWGGFAVAGLICTVALPACDPEGTIVDGVFVPTTCQASSTGVNNWGAADPCTFGAAAGEPIEVEQTAYSPPASEPSDTSPLPSGEPLDCTSSGCSVSANAGYGATDPGGFSYTLDDLTPGKYSFEAIGGSSKLTVKGSISLLPGPSS